MLADDGSLATAAPIYERAHLAEREWCFAADLGPGGLRRLRRLLNPRRVSVLSLRKSGRSRAFEYYDLSKAWFSEFSDIAKYFVGGTVASSTRFRYRPSWLEVINHRWQDRGPAPLWD